MTLPMTPKREDRAMHPDAALGVLSRHMMMDRLDILLDLERSEGPFVVDARTGDRWLDCYTAFASQPLGFNHPRLAEPAFVQRLGRLALQKPALSDTYTPDFAAFVERFYEVAAPSALPYLFTISGGALANENALKAAFDWKVRRNLTAGRPPLGSQAIHFRQAFHGRSGYTLGITDSADPRKTQYYPRFDWPRVDNPKLRFPVDAAEEARVAEAETRALAAIELAFDTHAHDIAAIIVEPIQAEGGDNHFRGEFLRALREVADRREALLVFDEVQTGGGATGKWWCHQHWDVVPDICVFGKKTQICGIMASRRMDEAEGHVFRTSSRINSTWGGDLVDAVRFTRILEVVRDEDLLANASRVGAAFVGGLADIGTRCDGLTNARGRGCLLAFDLPDPAVRNTAVRLAFERRLLVLPCGERSIRLRPSLDFPEALVPRVLELLEEVVRASA